MGLTESVYLVRGIDFGERSDGSDNERAWEWGLAANDWAGGDCEVSHPNGGDDRQERLVLYASASRRILWQRHAGSVAPVVDVLGAVLAPGSAVRTSAYDDALRAFCAARGLPRRNPRWLVTVDQS